MFSGSRLMWSLMMLSFGYCYHILKDRADLSKLVIRKSALSDQIAQKFGYCYQFYFPNAQSWAVFITNQSKLTLKIRQIRKMDKYIKNASKKSNIFTVKIKTARKEKCLRTYLTNVKKKIPKTQRISNERPKA